MFWKNKGKSQPGKISDDSSNLRDSFRVKPSLAKPIFLEINGKSLLVSDLSSRGVSFVNEGFKANDSHRVKFVLPHEEIEVTAELKILRIEESICHAKLFNVPMEMEDHIHNYVLYRQKEDLQSGKKYS